LASHTIGWWQRNLPAADPAECEPLWKVALAHELVLEAMRRTVIERLDSIMRFLAVGATPEQALYRLVDLVDELWPTAIADVVAASTDQKVAYTDQKEMAA
jgi:hypothetical protein